MNKHTPGPWRQGGGYDGIIGILAPEDGDGASKVVCDVFERDEQQANAKLIAAAPDLLEALVALLAAKDLGAHEFNAIDLAEAAIAKATQ